MERKLRNLLLNFACVFFISGVTFFIAYNWKGMGNMEKLSIPLSLIGLGIFGWFFWEKQERYRKISLFFASFSVGTLFALQGQIYQMGADAYQLFILWGVFILIFSCVEKSPAIWTLNAGVLALGGGLFAKSTLGDVYALYFSGIIFYLFFLFYCFLLKKWKFPLKNWFFYLFPTVGTGLINAGMTYSIFKNDFIFLPAYFIFLISLIFMGKKIMKKGGLDILVMISALNIFSSLSYKYLSRTGEGLTLYNFLIISLFLWVMKVIKEKYISTQSQRFILSIFKINLVFYLLSFLTLLISLLGLREGTLPFIGIFLLGISLYLPKKMEFLEDKSEIVTLATGIIFLVLYFSQLLKWGRIPCFFLVMVIYLFFWYFRHSRALDFLLLPIFTGGLLFISGDLGIKNITPIIALPFLPIIFSLLNNGEEKLKAKRVIRGSEITLMAYATVFYYDVFSFRVQGEILSLGITLISFFILRMILKGEKGVKYFILCLLLGGTGYFFQGNWGINLSIMLMLLYLQREEKYMFGVSIVFFAGQISFYYYKMNKTLLDKSYIMFKNSILLLIGHWILGRKK